MIKYRNNLFRRAFITGSLLLGLQGCHTREENKNYLEGDVLFVTQELDGSLLNYVDIQSEDDTFTLEVDTTEKYTGDVTKTDSQILTNTCPSVNDLENIVSKVGEKISVLVTATDVDKGSYNITGDLPKGATLDCQQNKNNKGNSCLFSWIPACSDVGVHTALFTVTDYMCNTSKKITIDVVAKEGMKISQNYQTQGVYTLLDSFEQTSDIGFVMSGSSSTDSLKITDSQGYVLKVDAQGAKEWELYLEKGSRAIEVHQTKKGEYILATKNLKSGKVYQIDSMGAINWMADISSVKDIRDIKEMTDGSYIAIGEHKFVQFAQDGTKMLEKEMGNVVFTSMATTLDNAVLCGGATLNAQGEGKSVLFKMDRNGVLLWKKEYEGTTVAYKQTVQQTQDQGYIAAIIGDGGYSNHLIKVDAEGNQVWTKEYFDLGISISAVRQTSDLGYLMVSDVTLLKTDANGKIEWQAPSSMFSKKGNFFDLTGAIPLKEGYVILGMDELIQSVAPQGFEFMSIEGALRGVNGCGKE